MGIDNRQYATYYGVQSNDNGVLSDDNWSQIPRLDPMRPMTFFYPTEYNVYENEMAPRITYRYVDDEWQKQFKFYDYLGSERFSVLASGQVINYKQYSAFGETLLDTLGFTRQGYIGKEKDLENGLGDHGVRKYDYETGRFNSPDVLWEKYYGWTPYHYTRNNPICRVDFNGMDDGQFGSWMQVGPIQQQILGEDMVKTYQDVVKYSDKPENKELVNTWAEIGIMGLTGIGTEAALATKAASNVLSKAGNFIKGLFGFGDEAAKGIDDLLKAGNAIDKSELTAVGKALQKHGSRSGSVFPEATGNPASINSQGESVLNGILSNPKVTSVTRHHARFGNVLEYKVPGGQGARFSFDGNKFIGFIEP